MAAKRAGKPIKPRAKAAPVRRAAKKPARRSSTRKKGPSKLGKLFLPAFFSLVIIGCLGFLVLMGYRTVTASDFFDVKKVEVLGTSRSSKEDIERIVGIETEKLGSWNADLPQIKSRVEKLSFVKTASVSRVLPNAIRVSVEERVPEAVVRTSAGDFLVDGEAVVIAPALNPEPGIPVVLRGWSEERSERASKENVERVKLFQKMLTEWKQFELAKRVTEVDLTNLRDPKAMVDESGSKISVALAKDELGKSLKVALEAIAGKGSKVKAVNAVGAYPVIEYIGN